MNNHVDLGGGGLERVKNSVPINTFLNTYVLFWQYKFLSFICIDFLHCWAITVTLDFIHVKTQKDFARFIGNFVVANISHHKFVN